MSRGSRLPGSGPKAVALAGVVMLLMVGVSRADTSGATTALVSRTPSGTPASGLSFWPKISADGRFVAFTSSAFDIVAGDTNACDFYGLYPGPYVNPSLPGSCPDIFVLDRVTGLTERVSVSSTGDQADDESILGSISADGRRVSFSSPASNLSAGDMNGFRDVFVRDRDTGATERVSVSSAGGEGNAPSGGWSMSSDGRFLAFGSTATNLVLGDTNVCEIFQPPGSCHDVFIRDRQTGTTERVSLSSAGDQGNDDSYGGVVSDDGRFVAFTSRAQNLVAGDANRLNDVFLRDRVSGQTTRVSLTSSGAESGGDSYAADISSDGRLILFQSMGRLVPQDVNGIMDVYLSDRVIGSVTLVSRTFDGLRAGADFSYAGELSPDDRFVVFSSKAPDLVPGDTSYYHTHGRYFRDVFLYEIATGTTRRISLGSDGEEANDESCCGSVSAGGRVVVFGSLATNLTPDPHPWTWHVYLRDRGDPCDDGAHEEGRLSERLHGLEDDAGPAGPAAHTLSCAVAGRGI